VNSEEIIELYSYNSWANEKLLEFVNILDLADFTRDMSNSFGSIRDTIVHIISAEEMWLSRWLGEEGRVLLYASNFPDVKSVNDRWCVHKSNINNFGLSLTDNHLSKFISIRI
jgi:uncharacterized damage-inducible protein DinB